MEPNCLFCDIVDGSIPSYKFYEDGQHLGILDLYPSVRGQALVLPKRHHGSYIFTMEPDEYLQLMLASRNVANLIDTKLGALRTCMVMEGMEVDHAHIKLYPIYEVVTAIAEGTIDLNKYRGYISTQHGERATDADLEKIVKTFQ